MFFEFFVRLIGKETVKAGKGQDFRSKRFSVTLFLVEIGGIFLFEWPRPLQNVQGRGHF